MIWDLSRAEPQRRGGSFASKGRFGEAEPEGCASIREEAEKKEIIFCSFSGRNNRVYEKGLEAKS